MTALPDVASWAVLLAVGFAAGAINTLAGGGSFLTLPALIFLGLPPTLANGTNRVAIVLQNAGASWGFHLHRVLDWRWALAASIPATAGAALGAWLALVVGDETFKDLLALFMVVISLWTLFDPLSTRAKAATPDPAEAEGVSREGVSWEGVSWSAAPRARRWGLTAGFFVVGVYGGFVQAGVGFLVLTATTAAGFDLVRGNAVKGVAIFFLSLLALGIFASQGQVDWPTGLILAVGMVSGSQVGVRLTVLKGHRWVRGVVTATILVFAVKLWLG